MTDRACKEMQGFMVAGYAGPEFSEEAAVTIAVLATSPEDAITAVTDEHPSFTLMGIVSEDTLETHLQLIRHLRVRALEGAG